MKLKKFLLPQSKDRGFRGAQIETSFLTRYSERFFYVVFFALLLGLYILQHIFPSQIGTGYIAVSFAMSILSGLAWYYDILTPRRALGLAVIGCLCLMPLLPYTSNDTQRYLWDGAVFVSGLDPYLVPPNDPLVANLREIWATPEEHAKYATLYPPGALTLFGLSSLAGPVYAIWVWKLMTTLALIASLFVTYKLLAARGLQKHIYLVVFSPLLLFETQVGGHLDIFSVLGIVLALWALDKEKVVLAGVIIGLAATTKFLPAVIVGPLLFLLPPRKAAAIFFSSALTWLGVYGLMFGLGYKPLGLLPTFFEKWRGGAPFFPLLDAVKQGLSLSNGQFLAGLIGLAICGFGYAAWLAKRREAAAAIMLSLSVPLLLSPVLFPWYVLALIPFLALRPSVTLFLVVTFIPLNYVVLNRWLSEGVWEQASWPALVLVLVIVTGLLVDLFMMKNRVNAPFLLGSSVSHEANEA